jgi:hypothetical protein
MTNPLSIMEVVNGCGGDLHLAEAVELASVQAFWASNRFA